MHPAPPRRYDRIMTTNIPFSLALASLFIDAVLADRYAALEDDEDADDYGSISTTSTSSRSLYKSLGFIISWLVAILVLRALVLLAGKIIVCLGEIFHKLMEDWFPNRGTDSGRRKVKRGRRASVSSYISLGSVR